ncbi:hypothetical protein SFC88_02590 [Nocardioides sp. HM23]|uniref:hypothetical protein n=1 Tax=Nocardioides bizhenqiangii TaxID=3095076 RepID=UPI002ACA4722|nr:hypothetical protein [Nocardioides sp. HM23]MDZ5619694.1 hypothetical protein [Nocardioides sp. HM23]
MSDETVFSGVHEVSVDLPTAPDQDHGLVLKWRRRGEILEGLVSREADGRVMTEWLPALLLSPEDSSTAPDNVPAES